MKLSGRINPKNLFRSKKHSTVSRSESSSFNSSITTSSGSPESSHHQHKSKSNGVATPTSVLPTHSHEISSDEWSEISADVQFELVQAFRIMDTDGDGRITRSELEALLSLVSWSTKSISNGECTIEDCRPCGMLVQKGILCYSVGDVTRFAILFCNPSRNINSYVPYWTARLNHLPMPALGLFIFINVLNH